VTGKTKPELEKKIVNVEVGSELFVGLWKVYVGDNEDWKEKQKSEYTIGNDLKKRFKQYIEIAEENLSVACEDEDNASESKPARKRFRKYNVEEVFDGDLIWQDPIGMLYAKKQTSRRQPWAENIMPQLAFRPEIGENAKLETLNALSIEGLAQVLCSVASDYDNGRIQLVFIMAKGAIDNDLFHKVDNDGQRKGYTDLRQMIRRELMGLAESNAKKVALKRICPMRNEFDNEDDQRAIMEAFCKAMVNIDINSTLKGIVQT
jgi:hypothetical protein